MEKLKTNIKAARFYADYGYSTHHEKIFKNNKEKAAFQKQLEFINR